MRYCRRNLSGFRGVFGFFDGDPYHMLNAFSVGDNLLGERVANLQQSGLETLADPAFLESHATAATSQQQCCVVCRSVPVNGNTVETTVGGFLQCRSQLCRSSVDIG